MGANTFGLGKTILSLLYKHILQEYLPLGNTPLLAYDLQCCRCVFHTPN